jgi:hypothetical protein
MVKNITLYSQFKEENSPSDNYHAHADKKSMIPVMLKKFNKKYQSITILVIA